MNNIIKVLTTKEAISNIREEFINKNNFYYADINCQDILTNEEFPYGNEKILNIPKYEKDESELSISNGNLTGIKEENIIILLNSFDKFTKIYEGNKINTDNLVNEKILDKLSKVINHLNEKLLESNVKSITLYLDYSNLEINNTNLESITEALQGCSNLTKSLESVVYKDDDKRNLDENQNDILKQISDINQNILNLKETFDDSIKYDKYKDVLFDKLHRELTQYKNGLIDRIVDNIAMDIIRMIDSTKRTINKYESLECSEENYNRIFSSFQGVIQDLQDILFRQSIEPYSLESEEVDVKKQKIISTIITNEELLDNKVASRIVEGYEKQGKVLRPERISIYKYKI